jgi:hypothetical protein
MSTPFQSDDNISELVDSPIVKIGGLAKTDSESMSASEPISVEDIVAKIKQDESTAKINFQTRLIRLVILATYVILGWLMLVYTISSFSSLPFNISFEIPGEERLIIIGAIATSSLGSIFTVIKSLFSIKNEKE